MHSSNSPSQPSPAPAAHAQPYMRILNVSTVGFTCSSAIFSRILAPCLCRIQLYKSYSPGLGPGRVRSWFFCVYRNICYVCKATFTFLIVLQHSVRLFSNFYNFCYSCFPLFGHLLFIVQKVRARGGLSRSPWALA